MSQTRILWIDDEMFLFRTFIYHLEREANCKVDGVETVTKALATITSNRGAWPYLLTILDINIRPAQHEDTTEGDAETAGLDILKQLREHQPDAEILLLSGVFERLDEQHLRELEGVPRIDKATLLIETLPTYVNRLKSRKGIA